MQANDHNSAIKPVIKLDLSMVECLLDGEAVELDSIVIIPENDLVEAHKRSVKLRDLRTPEPEFHL